MALKQLPVRLTDEQYDWLRRRPGQMSANVRQMVAAHMNGDPDAIAALAPEWIWWHDGPDGMAGEPGGTVRAYAADQAAAKAGEAYRVSHGQVGSAEAFWIQRVGSNRDPERYIVNPWPGAEVRGREVGRMSALADKIRGFRDLREGWDSYGALEIGEKTIDYALRLVAAGVIDGGAHASPGANGDICFEWTDEDGGEGLLEVLVE